MNITEDIHIEMETPDGRVQTITVPATNLSQAGVVTTRAEGSGVTELRLANSRTGERRRQSSGRGGGSPGKKSCGMSPGKSGRGDYIQMPKGRFQKKKKCVEFSTL